MIIESGTDKKPYGKDFKCFTGDACMVPDRGFVKQLKALDKNFEVIWDWGSKKWEIWRCIPGQEPMHQITVQTNERSYRELGADVLLKLQAGDPARFTRNELLNYFDELDEQDRRRKRKALRDKIHAMVGDTFDYARGVLKIQVPKSYDQIISRVAITGG